MNNHQQAPVWIVDDDRSIAWVLSRALKRAGIESRTFDNAAAVIAAYDDAQPLVLISDIRMPQMSGTELLGRIKAVNPEQLVIIMTAFSDLDNAVSAFQGGAYEYLAKPFDIDKAVALIERALNQAHATQEQTQKTLAPTQDAQKDELVGQAPAMQEVFRAIGRLSQSNVTVLLTGESGVGKEVVARAIWRNSRRAQDPFIAINMAAIPRELLESELFGHEKGAFTGAVARRLGRFEQAKGGTLFLDEIGDMPMELQTSLLRVLSNGYFYRVGGHEPIKADVRVIAATNQNLEDRVAKGLFREDLYHRLNVIRLRLPPLRERTEDIGPMAEHFLNLAAKEMGVEPKYLSSQALAVLEKFAFPGNVRQLENLCRWLLVMAPAAKVCVQDLPFEVQQGSETVLDTPEVPLVEPTWSEKLDVEVQARLTAGDEAIWKELSDTFERAVIRAALRVTGGRRIEAAQKLGLGRNTVTRKIKDLGIDE